MHTLYDDRLACGQGIVYGVLETNADVAIARTPEAGQHEEFELVRAARVVDYVCVQRG